VNKVRDAEASGSAATSAQRLVAECGTLASSNATWDQVLAFINPDKTSKSVRCWRGFGHLTIAIREPD
jgi:hypothetical protein